MTGRILKEPASGGLSVQKIIFAPDALHYGITQPAGVYLSISTLSFGQCHYPTPGADSLFEFPGPLAHGTPISFP